MSDAHRSSFSVQSVPQRPLPPGWRWVKLGEVTTVVAGTTPSTAVDDYWGGDIVWVTPADLGQLGGREICGSARLITKAGFHAAGLELVPVGAVVMSTRAPIGHLGIARIPLCTNQGCKAFVPSDRVHAEFLFWALRLAVPELQILGSGTTFKEVSKEAVESFAIPLPPLSEQRRIAGILNEQMQEVEKARAATEAQLEACRALPAAFLREVFPKRGQELPPGWRWVKLGEVATVVAGTTPSTAVEAYWGGDIVWVTPADLGQLAGRDIHGSARLITKAGFSAATLELVPAGAVVMSTRAPIGHLGIARVPLCTNQGCKAFVPSGQVSGEFLFWALKLFVPELQELGSGATFKEVSKETVEGFEVPLPPLSEQRRIAGMLNERMAEAEKHRLALEAQLETINKLPAALLRKAFRGDI